MLFLAVAASALAVAGCGSSQDNSAATTTSAAANHILGNPKPATGGPVSIGYVYDGTSDAIDNSNELKAAQASVKYVNEYLGGIGGRPIKLDVCSTDQNPAQAANCVTQFVTDKVLAVLNGVSGEGGSVFPALSKAGVPVFVTTTIDAASLKAPGIFVMGNGIASALAGPAKVAQRAHLTRAAIIVTDVPAAAGPVKAAASLFYGNAKVKPDIVAIPADAADMTPQVQAELSNNPGQFDIIGVPSFCARTIQAITSVGFKGDIVVLQSCIDSTTAQTAGSLKGVKMLTANSTDPNSAEFKLFAAVIDKYAPGTDLGGVTATGYQAVVGFARGLAGLTGDVTSASIIATLKAMPATPMPLGDGITFKCDGQQMPVLAPNMCSTAVLAGTLDANGKIDASGYSVLDVGDLLKIGG